MSKEKSAVQNMRRTQRSAVGTGTTSLLVIFTVLCMATLALLSLSTATSSRKINERSFKGVQNLVAAEGATAEKLAELDLMLLEQQQIHAGKDNEQYYMSVFTKLEELGCVIDVENKQAYFSFPIDGNHALVTRFQVRKINASTRYQLIEQSSQMTSEWEPEITGQYWTGS